MNALKGSQLDSVEKLTFYGLFKQAKQGDNNIEQRPGLFDPVGGAKWDAWDSRRGLKRGDARTQYVQMLVSIQPDWLPSGAQRPSVVPDHPAVSIPTSAASSEAMLSQAPPAASPRNATHTRRKSLEAAALVRSYSGNWSHGVDGDTNDYDRTKSSTLEHQSAPRGLPFSASAERISRIPSDQSMAPEEDAGMSGWLNKMADRENSSLMFGGGNRWCATRHFSPPRSSLPLLLLSSLLSGKRSSSRTTNLSWSFVPFALFPGSLHRNRRYFVLNGASLYYFRTEKDANPRGVFALPRCTVAREEKTTKKGKGQTFYILALYFHGAEHATR